MNHPELRQALVDAGRVLCANGQDDLTRGHVAARLPDAPDLFLMKPHSVGLDELTPESLLTIDLYGRVVAGEGRRHSEVFIHSEVFRARPDVMASLHTHPTYCVALSASGLPLRPCSQPGALFHRSLGMFDRTIFLIRSVELGQDVARALAGHRAVILKNHGIVCTGRDVAEAVIGAIMLENAAQIQLIAEATGHAAPDFPDADVETLHDALQKPEQFNINFDYLVRRLPETAAR